MMHYHADTTLQVVGLKHPELAQRNGGKGLLKPPIYGIQLYLHPEPENPKDKCAVVVTDLAYRFMGYLPAPLAPMVHSMLKRGIPVTCRVTNAPDYGVRIDAEFPEDIHPVLLAEAEHRDQNSGYARKRAQRQKSPTPPAQPPTVQDLLDEWDDTDAGQD